MNNEPTNLPSQPNTAHAAHGQLEHFQKHIRSAIGVFVALLVLTLVTVGASYIQFGRAGNITVALIIATIKAAMVAAIFMHLSAEKPAVFRVLLFTVIFFAGLMCLTLFAFHNAVDPSRVP
jgi:cytochrome c oxidase subunit 4